MSCFIPGCKTGYMREKWMNKKAGKKNYSLFSVRTDEMAQSWGSAIPRKDKILKKGDKICELHFPDSLIERDYVTLMPDGTVVRIPKGRPTLKPRAVPSIFTQEEISGLQREKVDRNGPGIIIEEPQDKEETKTEAKTETVKDQESIAEQEEDPLLSVKEEQASVSDCESLLDYRCQDLEDSLSDVTTVSNGSTKSELDFTDCMKVLGDQSPHATILKFYKLIKTPSESWLPCVTHGCAMWCVWKKDLSALDKRVVISPDMTVRIFIEERELPVAGMEKVEDIADIPDILDTVSRILPCPTVDGAEEERKNCVGYILRKKLNQRGPQRKRCEPCFKRRKALLKKLKRRTSEKQEQKRQKKREKEIKKLEIKCGEAKLGKKLAPTKQRDKGADFMYENHNVIKYSIENGETTETRSAASGVDECSDR